MTTIINAKPTCPACSSPDLRPEDSDRWQCRRCGWRIRIAADGSAQSWLTIGTAGRGQARKRGAAG